jgi:hypothetical protein
MNESGEKLLSSIRHQSSNNVANLTAEPVPGPQGSEEFQTTMKIPAVPSREPQFTLQDPYHSTSTTNACQGFRETLIKSWEFCTFS